MPAGDALPPLHQAVIDGDIRRVRELVANRANRESTYTGTIADSGKVVGQKAFGVKVVGQTALHAAALCNNPEAIAVLIAAGVNPEATYTETYANDIKAVGITAFHKAVINDNPSAIEALIRAGVNREATFTRTHPDGTILEGLTALHAAATKYDSGVVAALITAGVNPEATYTKTRVDGTKLAGLTALHEAARYASKGTVQYLCGQGLKVTYSVLQEVAAAQRFGSNTSLEIFKYLLEQSPIDMNSEKAARLHTIAHKHGNSTICSYISELHISGFAKKMEAAAPAPSAPKSAPSLSSASPAYSPASVPLAAASATPSARTSYERMSEFLHSLYSSKEEIYDVLSARRAESRARAELAEQFKRPGAKEYYDGIKLALSAAHTAGKGLSTGSVGARPVGRTGRIAFFTKGAGAITPGIGSVIDLMGDVISGIGERMTIERVKKFAKFATTNGEMDVVAEKVARHLVREGRDQLKGGCKADIKAMLTKFVKEKNGPWKDDVAGQLIFYATGKRLPIEAPASGRSSSFAKEHRPGGPRSPGGGTSHVYDEIPASDRSSSFAKEHRPGGPRSPGGDTSHVHEEFTGGGFKRA